MRLFTVVALIFMGMACEKPQEDTRLTLKIQSVGDQSSAPESYRLWINSVVLQNEAGVSNLFYICTSSAEDCEVDFSDPASVKLFEDKLSEVIVSTGTYSKIWVTCAPDSGGYVKIKDLLIPIENCGWKIPLAKPLAIADRSSVGTDAAPEGSSVTMSLFFNLQYQTGANYPNVFPYFGQTMPTLESYQIAKSPTSADKLLVTDATVLVKVIKDAVEVPFWASIGTDAVTAFRINTDGTLRIQSTGDGFESFQRAEHTGVIQGSGSYYKAFPVTP